MLAQVDLNRIAVEVGPYAYALAAIRQDHNDGHSWSTDAYWRQFFKNCHRAMDLHDSAMSR